jgi:hypothetical protein
MIAARDGATTAARNGSQRWGRDGQRLDGGGGSGGWD